MNENITTYEELEAFIAANRDKKAVARINVPTLTNTNKTLQLVSNDLHCLNYIVEGKLLNSDATKTHIKDGIGLDKTLQPLILVNPLHNAVFARLVNT